jgi:magnesium-protoporphyrin O-methyltransferase
MSCRQCQGIEQEFDKKYVAKELKKYHRKGPSKTTRMLLSALKAEGVKGKILLDIGGGLGAIQYELLKAGASEAINVEASTAYSEAASAEARRQGYSKHISYLRGNFVDLAKDISPVDIVTLDRVICCYDEMEDLVELSSQRAGKLYGAVYPQDAWWVKMGFYTINFFLRLFRRRFRTFLHPTNKVDALVRSQGLAQTYYVKAGVWQVAVYKRM